MGRTSRIWTGISIGVLVGALQGCAAIPIAVIAGSLLEAGGSVLVKTGTEYTSSGTVRRTFNLPADRVHAAVLETFRRAQIMVVRDEASSRERRIVGRVVRREVRVTLLPLTPVLTALELVVKKNAFASDKATASELLVLTERVTAEPTVLTANDPPIWEPFVRASKGLD